MTNDYTGDTYGKRFRRQAGNSSCSCVEAAYNCLATTGSVQLQHAQYPGPVLWALNFSWGSQKPSPLTVQSDLGKTHQATRTILRLR